MQKRIFGIVLLLHYAIISVAQYDDSVKTVDMSEVVVVADTQERQKMSSAVTMETVNGESYAKLFTGNLMNSIEQIAGVQSMSVGSGFSKPMIRGMAFNRVSVTENGVKQEGQQWGADHGLEIDAFNIERVNIHKGPSSLLFGSDAMGGVIEILPPNIVGKDKFFGSVNLLGRSVNGLLGGSVMLGTKQKNWFVKARYSEQHFADYKVPTDTIVYLTQKLPLASGRLNNTAGFERGANVYTRYGAGSFSAALLLSDSYQKVGFFAGAHGVPDPSDVIDDGNFRDIDLPYSTVNHFKSILTLKYYLDDVTLSWDLGYQNNHREEWSAFHTHYGSQQPPLVDHDKEISFNLDTYSSGIKVKMEHSQNIESTASWDFQYQKNGIEGYSFLLPNYERLMSGLAWYTHYKVSTDFSLSGGLRYDFGNIKSDEYIDIHLQTYLEDLGYSADEIEKYKVRSYALDRNFGDYSFALGFVWQMTDAQSLKANIGRCYRLPSVNELSANGVHHGSFRHEQGDPNIESERGWQGDIYYELKNKYVEFSLSPFLSLYENYIYIRPTGEWSILPHSGQIYRFSQTQALFVGVEASLQVNMPCDFRLNADAEYIYNYNIEANTPLPYSPPASVLTSLSWAKGWFDLSLNWKMVADQNRVARNEDITPGANLFGAAAEMSLPFINKDATIRLSMDNIFNTKYFNHLSFYRKIEVPEMGRNIQLSINLPF